MPKPKLVTSREYKVMLKPDLFDGDEAAFAAAVGEFWTALGERLAQPEGCAYTLAIGGRGQERASKILFISCHRSVTSVC